jgi:hypothetical protein
VIEEIDDKPVFEVLVYHSVGESLSADTNSFQHTVASELVHHQVRVNQT